MIIVSIRVFLRYLANYFRNDTVEDFLYKKYDELFSGCGKQLKRGFHHLKSLVVKTPAKSVAKSVALKSGSTIEIAEGFISYRRAYKVFLTSLARKTFYHVSFFTAKLLVTIYNKKIGKDDDDLELTTQKFLSQISFAVGSATAYSLCNGAFGVFN